MVLAVGPIMVSKHVVENWERNRSRMVHELWKEAERKQ